MNIVTTMHKHELHQVAHDKPFIARYHQSDFSLEDHYRHLVQLLPIYRALESKIKHCEWQIVPQMIPSELSYILSRSASLEQDIQFLKPFVSKSANVQLDATKKYVKEIEKLQGEAILIHFLIRILGDLFGGQGLKECVLDLYHKQNITSEEPAGVSFYSFPKPVSDALTEVSRWARGFAYSERANEFITDAYQAHLDIFDELEKTRSIFDRLPSIVKTTATLFSQNKAIFACAATLAVSALAVDVYAKKCN